MFDEKTQRQAQVLADQIRATTTRSVATRFTIDGEVRVYQKGALQEDGALPVVAFVGEALDGLHHDAVCILLALVESVRERGTRLVPVTRGEMRTHGVSRRVLAKLEQWGIVKQRIVKLNKVSGKNQPAQVVVYFTDRGRGYVRKFIDESYALSAEGQRPEALGPSDEAV